jgi:hypothetical protein
MEKESHTVLLSEYECSKFAVPDQEVALDSVSQRLPEPEPICLPVRAISNRSLSEDRAFSKIFNTYKICTEEKLENAKNQPFINAFRTFSQDRLYKELFMPTKKPEEEKLFSINHQEPQRPISLPKKNIQLVPKSIGEKTYEIAKKVENKSL